LFFTVSTVIFQDPVFCANFDYSSRNQDPKKSGVGAKRKFIPRFTTSEDVLEFIREKFPSENILVDQFRFSYARSISSFKIFSPPDVFKVLLSESFCLNDDLVIKEFVPNKPRTNKRPSTAPKN